MRNLGTTRVQFIGEEGDKVTVGYSNRGEPYREGIEMDFEQGERTVTSVFLETREVLELRDLLNKLYPPKGRY
jgi:hypothetical protein